MLCLLANPTEVDCHATVSVPMLLQGSTICSYIYKIGYMLDQLTLPWGVCLAVLNSRCRSVTLPIVNNCIKPEYNYPSSTGAQVRYSANYGIFCLLMKLSKINWHMNTACSSVCASLGFYMEII